MKGSNGERVRERKTQDDNCAKSQKLAENSAIEFFKLLNRINQSFNMTFCVHCIAFKAMNSSCSHFYLSTHAYMRDSNDECHSWENNISQNSFNLDCSTIASNNTKWDERHSEWNIKAQLHIYRNMCHRFKNKTTLNVCRFVWNGHT